MVVLDFIIKMNIPINDSFMDEVDERSKHTSLYLKDLPSQEPPVRLRETSPVFLDKSAEEQAEIDPDNSGSPGGGDVA